MRLTKAQTKFLRKLSPEEGHYRHVRYEEVGLSLKGYRAIVNGGLVLEAWTWRSRTRPDVALSNAGRAALATKGEK